MYYGWFVVAACNGVAFITWGVAIFNQGVFVSHYITQNSWSPATLSVGPVLFHICAGFAGVPIGRYIDTKGPRRTLLLGACLVGGGTVALGLVREEWHTFPAFVLLGCGFACIHTITLGKIVTRWFVRDRARAMAAATFGAGFGGAILVPLNAFVIGEWGVLAAGVVLAAVTLGIIGPVALWVIKDGPEAVGQNPDWRATAEPDEAHAREIEQDSRLWTLHEAFRTVAFWGLSSCFAIGMLAQGSYLVHQMIFLQSTFGMIGSAWIVTVTTLMGLVGRIGFMLIGRVRVVRIDYGRDRRAATLGDGGGLRAAVLRPNLRPDLYVDPHRSCTRADVGWHFGRFHRGLPKRLDVAWLRLADRIGRYLLGNVTAPRATD
jgi:MFS family permease